MSAVREIATAAGALYVLAERSMIGAIVVPLTGNPDAFKGIVEQVSFGYRGEVRLMVSIDGTVNIWDIGDVVFDEEA